MVRRWCPAAVLLALPVAVAQPPFPQMPGNLPTAPPPLTQQRAAVDKDALAAARLSADDTDGLLTYLRRRTLTDADLTKVTAVIRQLGAESFDERVKAASEVDQFGPAAVAPLRAALNDPDPEIAFRAGECLQRLQTVPHPAVAAAAVRVLGERKPAGAAAALLGFLPSADDATTADDIRVALAGIATRPGDADPALTAGLSDPVPVRRAAAFQALLANRDRPADLSARLTKAATGEADRDAKFVMLFGLATTAGETDAVGPLIDLLPTLAKGQLWQAEDFLLQLAGAAGPKGVLGGQSDALYKAAESWAGWWRTHQTRVDLKGFKYRPRTTGRLVLTLVDSRGDSRFGGLGAVGSVVELDPALGDRWRLAGLNSPLDARVTPEAVVVAESNLHQLTFYAPNNKLLAGRPVAVNGLNQATGSPHQLHLLDNGNLLVVCRNVIVEYAGTSNTAVMGYVRTQYDIADACRLPDGRTFVLLHSDDPAEHCLLLDKAGKELPDRPVRVAKPDYQAYTEAAGPNRVLVTEPGRIAEYDLSAGKLVWSRAANLPRSVQRLANGNTLFVEAGPTGNRIVEVAPTGEEVWAYTPPDPGGKGSTLQVWRAHRR
jgi:hypothetical protein